MAVIPASHPRPHLRPTHRFPPPALLADTRFARHHVWLPLACAAALVAIVQVFDLNQRFADLLFALEGHRWALKNAFVTETLLHKLGHDASLAAWAAVLLAWLGTFFTVRLRHWRKPLGYLVLAVLLSTGLVAWIKSWSNMDCPWDLLRYGGTRPFVGLFDLRPVGMERARCFPAGQASAGYGWVALYFFLAVVRPQWRHAGLAVGLGAGLLLGFAQQLRGAHFLSHDLWTLILCWATAVCLFRLFWPHREAENPTFPTAGEAS